MQAYESSPLIYGFIFSILIFATSSVYYMYVQGLFMSFLFPKRNYEYYIYGYFFYSYVIFILEVFYQFILLLFIKNIKSIAYKLILVAILPLLLSFFGFLCIAILISQ
jgi:hypothetical protein